MVRLSSEIILLALLLAAFALLYRQPPAPVVINMPPVAVHVPAPPPAPPVPTKVHRAVAVHSSVDLKVNKQPPLPVQQSKPQRRPRPRNTDDGTAVRRCFMPFFNPFCP